MSKAEEYDPVETKDMLFSRIKDISANSTENFKGKGI